MTEKTSGYKREEKIDWKFKMNVELVEKCNKGLMSRE